MFKISDLFKKKSVDQEQTAPAKMIPVLMKNGVVEEYPEHFIISDKKNCVVCSGKMYHTSLDCSFLKTEMNGGTQVKAMKIYDANAHGFDYCYECQKEMELNEELFK